MIYSATCVFPSSGKRKLTGTDIAKSPRLGSGFDPFRRGVLNSFGIMGLAIFSAGTAFAQAEGAVQDTSLVMSHPQEPPNWNYWQTAATALTVPVFHNIIEPLVEKSGNGSVIPLLAESWEISADGLVYTFKIREAKFHDGTGLDAADVVYSLLKNKESPNGSMSGPLAPVVSITSTDPRTVVMTLTTPSQRLLSELGLAAGMIVPEGLHEASDLNSVVIGTGPYVFGTYQPDVDLTLSLFADYWGPKPFFEDVKLRFIPDETTAINALLAGEIDMVGAILGEGLDRIAAVDSDAAFALQMPAPYDISYIFLSTKSEKLADIRVRQAIAHAIVRDDILLGAQAGYGETICQMVIPFNEPWNNGYCPYGYDPEKSRALLAEAGVENLALDFPSLTVAEFPAMKDVIVAQMAEVGIKLEVRDLDLATWLAQVYTDGDYDFSTLTNGVPAEAYACGRGTPPFGYADSPVCDETFDALVASSDAIVDGVAYRSAMDQMVAALTDSAWVIPIHAKSSPTLARADLVGFKAYRYRLEMDLRNLKWAE